MSIHFFRYSGLAASLLIAPLVVSNAAHADQIVRSEHVAYADLDLVSDAGQASLMKRVNHAVDRVCGGRPNAGALQDWSSFDSCSTRAKNDVEPKVAEVIAAAKQHPHVDISIDVSRPGSGRAGAK